VFWSLNTLAAIAVDRFRTVFVGCVALPPEVSLPGTTDATAAAVAAVAGGDQRMQGRRLI
jgi:hypothetical protein